MFQQKAEDRRDLQRLVSRNSATRKVTKQPANDKTSSPFADDDAAPVYVCSVPGGTEQQQLARTVARNICRIA
jgi:hypothetical protein